MPLEILPAIYRDDNHELQSTKFQLEKPWRMNNLLPSTTTKEIKKKNNEEREVLSVN